MKPMITTRDLANLLGIQASTVCEWRIKGGGPAFIKIGHLVRYRPEVVDEWIKARTFANTTMQQAG